MDALETNYNKYISHLFDYSSRIAPRDTSVYFDCTNYYFETKCEDDDYIDEVTSELIKDRRKYEPSKEHSPDPLVEMIWTPLKFPFLRVLISVLIMNRLMLYPLNKNWYTC